MSNMSSIGTSHKPRKKKKSSGGLQRTPTNADIVAIDEHSNAVKPGFPLVAFLWPARGTTSQWVLIPLILMIVGLFRWTVGLWDYSGTSIGTFFGTLLILLRVRKAANAW
jgi:alpha-1,3-glucosyltransferase